MIEMTLDEVAQAVGGQVAGGDAGGDARGDSGGDASRVVVASVAVDSRLVEPGALFVAMPGERVDGHDYVQAALDAGATASLSSRQVPGPHVLVTDAVDALGKLARHLLSRLPDVTVIGITGSNGKTSAKDLMAQVLPDLGPTIAPVGSFNNEIGLPLTVLRADLDTRYLVLEMGARGIGHVEYLCQIAPPDYAVELNVGHAHVGEFGSQAAIARAKSELVQALTGSGTAVLNADDQYVRQMAEVTEGRVVMFGEAPDAELRVQDVSVDELTRPSCVLVRGDQRARLHLQLLGEHHLVNAAATAAVATGLGMSLARAAELLGRATPRSRWRMELGRAPGGAIVINDSYNANPESMRAGLKSLATIGRSKGPGTRTWAVLGEMLELGDLSVDEHDAIGRLAVRLDIDQLVVVGPGARPIHLGAAHEGSWDGESVFVPDVQAAADLLAAELGPDDVVFIKASRGSGLDRVAELLGVTVGLGDDGNDDLADDLADGVADGLADGLVDGLADGAAS